jgi:TolA-binding protein
MRLHLLLIATVLAVGCKTREDIEREQRVNDMSVQVIEGQKLSADVTVRLQAMEERLNSLGGVMEETSHEAEQKILKRLTALEERLVVLEEGNKVTGPELAQLKADVAAQSKYIQDVLGTLKNLSGTKSAPAAKAKEASPYEAAMELYGKGRYKDARAPLIALYEDKKITGARRARILHNLGMIDYMAKNDQESLVFFSRLFTEFPKSGYNKNGLLHLGRIFQRLNKPEEARQSYTELVNRFPDAKEAKTAKANLEKL